MSIFSFWQKILSRILLLLLFIYMLNRELKFFNDIRHHSNYCSSKLATFIISEFPEWKNLSINLRFTSITQYYWMLPRIAEYFFLNTLLSRSRLRIFSVTMKTEYFRVLFFHTPLLVFNTWDFFSAAGPQKFSIHQQTYY